MLFYTFIFLFFIIKVNNGILNFYYIFFFLLGFFLSYFVIRHLKCKL